MRIKERETGIGPAAFSLARRRSTDELLPRPLPFAVYQKTFFTSSIMIFMIL